MFVNLMTPKMKKVGDVDGLYSFPCRLKSDSSSIDYGF